jgi:hypothetical protein
MGMAKITAYLLEQVDHLGIILRDLIAPFNEDKSSRPQLECPFCLAFVFFGGLSLV